MKVYIVQTHDYYASSIEHVFLSEAVAHTKAAAMAQGGGGFASVSVVEHELEGSTEGLTAQLEKAKGDT